jgi:hypothetical protein
MVACEAEQGASPVSIDLVTSAGVSTIVLPASSTVRKYIVLAPEGAPKVTVRDDRHRTLASLEAGEKALFSLQAAPWWRFWDRDPDWARFPC